jgi:hypothetical protein
MCSALSSGRHPLRRAPIRHPDTGHQLTEAFLLRTLTPAEIAEAQRAAEAAPPGVDHDPTDSFKRELVAVAIARGALRIPSRSFGDVRPEWVRTDVPLHVVDQAFDFVVGARAPKQRPRSADPSEHRRWRALEARRVRAVGWFPAETARGPTSGGRTSRARRVGRASAASRDGPSEPGDADPDVVGRPEGDA